MPPSTNSMYKPFNGRFMVNVKAKADKEAMAWEARAQYRGDPIEGDLVVEAHLTWPTRRNHDVDNIKSLLDALKGILWVDDAQIVDLRVTKRHEKGIQGVILTVRKRQ
jgi:Holliday junction resolvase RusA-like endonuclease